MNTSRPTLSKEDELFREIEKLDKGLDSVLSKISETKDEPILITTIYPGKLDFTLVDRPSPTKTEVLDVINVLIKGADGFNKEGLKNSLAALKTFLQRYNLKEKSLDELVNYKVEAWKPDTGLSFAYTLMTSLPIFIYLPNLFELIRKDVFNQVHTNPNHRTPNYHSIPTLLLYLAENNGLNYFELIPEKIFPKLNPETLALIKITPKIEKYIIANPQYIDCVNINFSSPAMKTFFKSNKEVFNKQINKMSLTDLIDYHKTDNTNTHLTTQLLTKVMQSSGFDIKSFVINIDKTCTISLNHSNKNYLNQLKQHIEAMLKSMFLDVNKRHEGLTVSSHSTGHTLKLVLSQTNLFQVLHAFNYRLPDANQLKAKPTTPSLQPAKPNNTKDAQNQSKPKVITPNPAPKEASITKDVSSAEKSTKKSRRKKKVTQPAENTQLNTGNPVAALQTGALKSQATLAKKMPKEKPKPIINPEIIVPVPAESVQEPQISTQNVEVNPITPEITPSPISTPEITLPQPALTDIVYNSASQKLFDKLSTFPGTFVKVGSDLEEPIRDALRKAGKDVVPLVSDLKQKRAIISYPEENPKDIDMAAFTNVTDFSSIGLTQNENKPNLLNSNKSLFTEIGMFVDLSLYPVANSTDYEAITQNMLDRDFVHSSVYGDKDRNVFDPTGRGIEAIRTRTLSTNKPALESFKEDPVRILRAIKCILEDRKPDADLKKTLKEWNIPVDVKVLVPTLRKHLLQFDNYAYISRLMDYGLLKSLFGFSNTPPKGMPLDQYIGAVKTSLRTLAEIREFNTSAPVLYSQKEDNGIIRVKEYKFDKNVRRGFMVDTNQIKYPLNKYMCPLAQAEISPGRYQVYPINKPCILADSNVIMQSPLIGSNGVIFCLDLFQRAFRFDEKTKQFRFLSKEELPSSYRPLGEQMKFFTPASSSPPTNRNQSSFGFSN